MDDKKFKELLDQYAEWEYVKVRDAGVYDPQRQSRYALERKLKRLKEMQEELLEEDPALADSLDFEGLQAEIDSIDVDKPNPTLGRVVTKIKHPPVVCQDCGKTVEGRVIEQKMYWTNKPHWRKKCTGGGCGLYQSPYTGKFELTGTQSQIAWARYTRNTGKYNTKYNPKNPGSTDVDDK